MSTTIGDLQRRVELLEAQVAKLMGAVAARTAALDAAASATKMAREIMKTTDVVVAEHEAATKNTLRGALGLGAGLTTDPNDPRLRRGADTAPRPQSEAYLVLPEEERAKGFVRPVRRTYRHVGLRPKGTLRDLTDDERERFASQGYAKVEEIDREVARYWTRQQLDKRGCGVGTTMGAALAETYAREPKFYGSTYCCGCCMHLPVEEFVWWPDGEEVGS